MTSSNTEKSKRSVLMRASRRDVTASDRESVGPLLAARLSRETRERVLDAVDTQEPLLADRALTRARHGSRGCLRPALRASRTGIADPVLLAVPEEFAHSGVSRSSWSTHLYPSTPSRSFLPRPKNFARRMFAFPH
jgi:hypothetical protein